MPEKIKYRELYRLLGENRLFRAMNVYSFVNEYAQMRDQDKLEARYTRELLLNVFNVQNLTDINLETITDEQIAELESRMINLWAEMYGISNDQTERRNKVIQALSDADSVIKMIEDPRFGVFRSIHTEISAVNEVILEKNPIKLLLILFSNNYSAQAKFEARRKLILADLALAVHCKIDEEIPLVKEFTQFLDESVFCPPIGETTSVEVFSTHSPIDYSCLDVQVLEPGERVSTNEFKLFHKLKMRRWKDKRNGEHLVQIDQRVKDIGAFIVKILRKDEKSAGVVDDPLGFKLVFLTKREIDQFLSKLQQEGAKSGFFVRYLDPYDTVANDNEFRITNPGSSNKLEIVKVHLNFKGTLIELQLHTVRSHLDSRIADGRGHEEFSLSRLVATGKWDESVMDLLYPVDIYGNGWKDAWPELIADVRESNRHRSALLPVERSAFGDKEVRYSDHFLAGDIAILMEKMAARNTEVLIPDVIVIPGRNELFGASELSLALGGVKIIIASQCSTDEIKMQTAGKSVLIFDDIADKCRNISVLKELIPHAQVASLVVKGGSDANATVNYFARQMPENERVRFFWERGRMDEGYRPPVHAVVLPYKVENGELLILCQEVESRFKDKRTCYKLVGGAKELVDIDLKHTVLREISEEVAGLEATNLKLLGQNGYHYTKKGTIYTSGFVRAYGVNISDDNHLRSIDAEVKKLGWIKASDLKGNLHPAEYQNFIEQWLSQIEVAE